jgi:predicted DCC family thiol-disulfide oxidoreductase YuxK
MKKITVFYDGKCSLCAKEIAHYKKIASEEHFYFCDITQDSELFTQLGYEVTTGLKLLHVSDSTGTMQIGLDAFITIWRELPWWKYLAWLANLPIIHYLLSITYKKFAAWRYKRNRGKTCGWQ